MDHAKVLAAVKQHRAIAVLRAPSAEGAIRACEAMRDGGLVLMEVTTTTADWERALEGVARLDKVILGVGTLVLPAQVKVAKAAGAAFAVSPGYDREVADACLTEGLSYFPGIATPTELMQARKHPATAALKLFPAGELGGAKYLQALRGPFPDAAFVPTGGVTAENAKDYFKAGALAVGLSAICKADAIRAGDWESIRAATAAFLATLA